MGVVVSYRTTWWKKMKKKNIPRPKQCIRTCCSSHGQVEGGGGRWWMVVGVSHCCVALCHASS